MVAPFRDIGPLPSHWQSKYCSRVNIPFATNTADIGGPLGRTQAQEHVFTLLRSVQRGFRRQYLELAEDHGLPFRLAGPGLALLQEISERPGVTVNEVARLTGLSKSRVSVLMSDLADQGIVRKESDSHDSRLVRLHVTAQGFGHIVEWSALAQQAMGQLLQPLSDEELDLVAEGLAVLDRAFQLAATRSSAEQHTTTELPC